MFEGSLVLGLTLLGFAFWLHWNETYGWPDESFVTELDNKYAAQRKRSRRRIHWIIGTCGTLILIAAFVGPGAVWLGAWLVVMCALATVIFLAGIDAIRTRRYQQDKLPEIRRHVLHEDE